MSNPFFDHPILNSPYAYPMRHWELDAQGQPTQTTINKRRRAEFITPIPKPRLRKGEAAQGVLPFQDNRGVSNDSQQYYHSDTLNAVRAQVDAWRKISNPADWRVTPETARLLEHWRHFDFSGARPFFCQIEAIETVIWLTEVAPVIGKTGRDFLHYLEDANQYNQGLMRLALKLATGAGKTTVMAMIVAWQTVNALRECFSNQILIAKRSILRDEPM